MEEAKVDGGELLLETMSFGRQVLGVTQAQLTAMTLAGCVSHLASVDVTPRPFNSALRVALTGDSRAGKSTGMRYGFLISANPWMSDSTAPGIRAFFNRKGPKTFFMDEASKTFGEAGLRGRSHQAYKILTEGFDWIGTLSFSVDRSLQEVSTFGVAWVAGIGEAVPHDVLMRSIRIRMEKSTEDLADILDTDMWETGLAYRQAIHDWIMPNVEWLENFSRTEVRKLHPRLRGTIRQIWGPLFAIAHLAGGELPTLCMEAFLELGIDRNEKPKPTPGQQLVLDADRIIADNGLADVGTIFTADLVDELREMDDRDYHRKGEQYLLQEIARHLGPARNIRGDNLLGIVCRGKGGDTAPIQARAAEIREKLNPAPAVEEAEEDELAMEPEPALAVAS